MNVEELEFRTTSGQPIFYRRCRSAAAPRATVVVVHGLCEHGGRYVELADQLCRAGYAVFLPDLRGHGRSPGPRALVLALDEYLDDLQEFLAAVRRQEPAGPLFLLGHSMGGAIAARLVQTRTVALDGLILSAPAARVADTVFPWLRRIAGFISRFFPRLRVVRIGSRGLSRDPAVAEDFRRDPLVFHDRFPVRTGTEILRAAAAVREEAARIRVPLMVLHGTGDFVTDPEGSRMLWAQAATADKTLKLYAGLYHDLVHEPERAAVVADVLDWLAARCGVAVGSGGG